MPDDLDVSQPTDRRRRRRLMIAGAGVAIAVAAVVLALFQPWKLWIDDEVDEAAPAGAVPVTAPVASAPTTVPPTSPPVSPPPTASSAPEASTTSPASTAPVADAPAPPPTTTVASTAAPVPVGGEFISIDHGTTGMAVVLQDAAGAQYVRLQDLDTSNGPDLFVYLSVNPHDGPEGQFDDDFVNLGRLEGNVGSSNYAIPVGTDVFRYASVVIWCDRFNSAFGAAPLG